MRHHCPFLTKHGKCKHKDRNHGHSHLFVFCPYNKPDKCPEYKSSASKLKVNPEASERLGEASDD